MKRRETIREVKVEAEEEVMAIMVEIDNLDTMEIDLRVIDLIFPSKKGNLKRKRKRRNLRFRRPM